MKAVQRTPRSPLIRKYVAVRRKTHWCRLEQLPEGQREILVLVVIEGLTYEEAAAVLDIPLGTVRSRVARARQAVKNFLDGGQEERVKVVR